MSERRYCSNCGAPISEGALYCGRCGRQLNDVPTASSTPPPTWGSPGTPTSSQPPYHNERYEKHEKQEKREKGEKHEKGGRNGWIGPLFGGTVLIWIGIILTLAASGSISWNVWWDWFLAGLGILLVLEGAILSISRGRSYPFIGFFIGGIVVFLIGFTQLFSAFNFWPLILVIIGIFVVAGALMGRRRTPKP